MKKVIRLTESDLVKIVKRVINEASETDCSINCQPGTGSGDRAIAQKNCCSTGNKNSDACKKFIQKYNPALSKCTSISFPR